MGASGRLRRERGAPLDYRGRALGGRDSDVEVPVRILQGNEDDIVSVENAAAIAEHLPDGELVELPGEDHSSRNDEEQVLEMTLSFLG